MLLDYNTFLLEKQLVESRRDLLMNIFNQFEDIKPVMHEAKVLVESGVFDEVFDMINEENLVDRMKDKFNKAVEVAKEKGKSALTDMQSNILKLGGKIGNVIKMMVTELKNWINETFQSAKATYTKFAKSKEKEIKNALESAGEGTKNLIIKEVQQLKKVSTAVVSWMTGGLVKDVAKGSEQVVKQDIKESLDAMFELAVLDSINEAIITGKLDFTQVVEEGGGIPFVSTIAHELHNIPPFDILNKIKEKAADKTGTILNKLSLYATEFAGAPGPFEFVALATLVGILTEVALKHTVKHALVASIPGIGVFSSIISNTAMALAVVGIVETLIKTD